MVDRINVHHGVIEVELTDRRLPIMFTFFKDGQPDLMAVISHNELYEIMFNRSERMDKSLTQARHMDMATHGQKD